MKFVHSVLLLLHRARKNYTYLHGNSAKIEKLHFQSQNCKQNELGLLLNTLRNLVIKEYFV